MAQITVTQADDGKPIHAKQGDEIVVELAENATTGFGWDLEPLTSDAVSLVKTDYAMPSSTGVGGGGTRVFTFKAVRAGSAHFRLKQWRRWEGDRSIRKRFAVTIHVQE